MDDGRLARLRKTRRQLVANLAVFEAGSQQAVRTGEALARVDQDIAEAERRSLLGAAFPRDPG